MQAFEDRTHLAICSFFNTAAGYSSDTTFGYVEHEVGGKSQNAAPRNSERRRRDL
jgi:hypothetical protein